MNILMVHPHDIYSPKEPWSVRIVYLAREFEKKGHQVKLVYFPLPWENQQVSEISPGISAIPLSRHHGPHVLLKNICRVFRLAQWADVVHFQKCFYNAALPAMIAACVRGKHLHYDWDDWEVKIYEVSTKPGLLRDLIRWFLIALESSIPLAADTISVASQRLRVECKKITKKEENIVDAHVGADLLRFSPSLSGAPVRETFGITRPLVLYLGQLHGGQYVELFIRTAEKLVKEYKEDYSFMIVGDGYMANALKTMAKDKGLDGALIFAGAIAHELVPSYIAAADVCVACFEENDVTRCKSPLKVVEYLASGKAIVASNVGEVPAMLGDAGILTVPGDSDSLAQGIRQVLSDRKLKAELEKRARKRAEVEYNWEVTARNILKAYRNENHHP